MNVDDHGNSFARFIKEEDGRRVFYVRKEWLEDLREAGLDRPEGWERTLAIEGNGEGRGLTARLRLKGGLRIVVKKMRRGGLLRPLWRDRYLGNRRLLANIANSEEASRRGIATPSVVALCLRRRGARLFESWIATEEIADTRDLLTGFRDGTLSGETLAVVMDLVREMHDRGVHHTDLHLANLLFREKGEGSSEAFVVDLDRARLEPGPIGLRARRRSLRRMDRSYVKHVGRGGPLGDDSHDVWARLYAGENADLARRMSAGKWLARILIAIHSGFWRR
jgi:3-deoxy-D-manno-octulosonic acid kinase